VCDLAVPANKTSTEFIKPVDHVVGEAVQKWEAERPEQPSSVDEKTGEVVDFLFMFRGTSRMRKNEEFLRNPQPALCRIEDVRLRNCRWRA
jgi:hypothetical protein